MKKYLCTHRSNIYHIEIPRASCHINELGYGSQNKVSLEPARMWDLESRERSILLEIHSLTIERNHVHIQRPRAPALTLHEKQRKEKE